MHEEEVDGEDINDEESKEPEDRGDCWLLNSPTWLCLFYNNLNTLIERE